SHSSSPTDLSVTSLTSTTLDVSWSFPIDTCAWRVTHYQVTYYGIGIDTSLRTVTTVNENYQITGLEEYTDYIIEIKAANSNYTSQASSIHIRTASSAPSGPPLNVTLLYIDKQVAFVSWLPPAVIQQNGIISHYQLALTNTDNSLVVDEFSIKSGYNSYNW
ncbi:fibronectin type III domain-containing protein, partial [Salmonella sp. s51228]|uniref:fibronectin type III domain-containing protein n=1 Tax=Salmonella sp. s51228 TaxID=3159652 RepID=UPI00397FA144